MPIYLKQLIVLGVTVVLLVMLLREKVRPSYIFLGSALVFLLTGVVTTADFVAALSNESILSIFLLIFITAGLKEHFNMGEFLNIWFGKSKNPRFFMFRMTTGVATVSAFVNNTPLVALMMPYVYQWSKKNQIAPSKFLLPLSYAAIIGGMITVIGTSKNLVLNGLIESKNIPPLTLENYFFPGILVTIAGVLFLYFFGYSLLPSRNKITGSLIKQAREYVIETIVPVGSSLIGKSVTDANLRNLPGIYLFEIVRKGRAITPIDPSEIIEAGDSLFFAGETSTIMDLLKRENELALPTTPKGVQVSWMHNLVEAVIPINSELQGQTLKQLEFRENYDAAVVAIHRNGEKLRGKIGEMVMQAGDLLLISTGHNFYQLLKSKPSLYLVSILSKTTESKPWARKGFFVIVALAIPAIAMGLINMFLALMIIIAYMVIAKLLSLPQMKKEFDVDLLIILVSSLTFSKAIIDTGAAEYIVNMVIPFFNGFGNAGILTGLFIVTVMLSSVITHVGTVSIMFPIAYAIGLTVPGMSFTALFLATAFASSASFHAPFSYQTQLMVYGPGGYRFKDYLKIGLPFTIIYSFIALVFIILMYDV